MNKHETRVYYGVVFLTITMFLLYAISNLLVNKEDLYGFIFAAILVAAVYFSGWLVEFIINKLKYKER